MVRVIVATVGWTVERVWNALLRVGFSSGDVVYLVNSVPREERSESAMRELVGRVSGVARGVRVEGLWVDPGEGFTRVVARLRSLPERHAPCDAVFLAVGGFRWLVLAAALAALVEKSVALLRGVQGVRLVLTLEESPSALRYFPDPDSRIFEVPLASGIAPQLHPVDLEIIDAIAGGVSTARGLARRLRNVSERNLYRRLARLEKLGLVEVVDRRSGRNVYRLTPLGEMLARLPGEPAARIEGGVVAGRR